MDIKCKLKTCIASLLLLNIYQFNTLKLYSDLPQRKSFSEICIDDRKVDEVKACQTLDQAARFSQLIENIVQDLRVYSIPWSSYKTTQETYENYQTKLDALIKELTSETITPEDKIKKKKQLESLQKIAANAYTRLETTEKQIENCTNELGNFPTPWESLQEAFNKFKLDNVNSIKLEKITLSTDDEDITCYVYSPKSDRDTPPYPCIFWLHGGNVGIKDNLRYSDPNQLDISFDDFLSSSYNFTLGLQPLARFLVQNGIALATVTIRGKNGKGNVRKQIKDQIEEIKKLDYIDKTKMAFIGHSNGGHIVSQMIANEYTFLNDNFKLGVGLASPYINESWGNSLIERPKVFDSFNGFAFRYAAPDNVSPTFDCSKPVKNFQGEEAEYVYKYVNPFSITSGMSREELQNILDQLTIPVFLFVGLKDNNTAPTTQNGTVAWLLKETGFKNWRTFTYPGAAHSPHRIQYIKTNENIPDDTLQAFQDMLSDILSIGKGTPNKGTQNLKVFNQDKKIKQYSPEVIFLQFENGEKRQIKFKDTDCGKDLLSE